MPIPIYAAVRLRTDRFRNDGAAAGLLGYVIEAYANGDYEVEFSGPHGVTIAQIVAREPDLELAEDEASSRADRTTTTGRA